MMNAYVGNLTKDVESRQTQGGISVANFSIAINEKFENSEKEITTFLDFEAWGYKALDVANLKKGQKIVVLATPRNDTWEKDGKKYSKVKFRVLEVGLCLRTKRSDQVDPETTAAIAESNPVPDEVVGVKSRVPF